MPKPRADHCTNRPCEAKADTDPYVRSALAPMAQEPHECIDANNGECSTDRLRHWLPHGIDEERHRENGASTADETKRKADHGAE
jgi:hypothetical protein